MFKSTKESSVTSFLYSRPKRHFIKEIFRKTCKKTERKKDRHNDMKNEKDRGVKTNRR
jgi:hypothetical protein